MTDSIYIAPMHSSSLIFDNSSIRNVSVANIPMQEHDSHATSRAVKRRRGWRRILPKDFRGDSITANFCLGKLVQMIAGVETDVLKATVIKYFTTCRFLSDIWHWIGLCESLGSTSTNKYSIIGHFRALDADDTYVYNTTSPFLHSRQSTSDMPKL